MKRRQLLLAFAAIVACRLTAATFPDYGYQPPKDWQGETFALSQSYPNQPPTGQGHPWEQIEFKERPEEYMQAVLSYCFEGNVENDFVPQKNAVRKWYHAPWLHVGRNQREFVRGLTQERGSRPYELSPLQKDTYRNFAVGFYNEEGGYTIGRVWRNAKPDASQAVFPEGTVSFKLLFTTAPESVAPYLQGAPAWVADINKATNSAAILLTQVRLLQIDISVKDRRSLCGGWVFGTFHYDASIQADSPWKKLRALSLTWGNDPGLTTSGYQKGDRPKESWVNASSPIAIYRSSTPTTVPPAPRTFGLSGRANGPVDNPASSCLSCHGAAQTPATDMMPPDGATESETHRWFRNLSPMEAFAPGGHSLDFSLQLSLGIQNYKRAHPDLPNARPGLRLFHVSGAGGAASQEPEVSRDPE